MFLVSLDFTVKNSCSQSEVGGKLEKGVNVDLNNEIMLLPTNMAINK